MVKYLKNGQDFQFSSDFGFTGSAQGRHDARDHSEMADDDEYGDGSYVERAKGGRVGRKGYAMGGATVPTGNIPIPSQRPVGAAQPQQVAQGALNRATVTMPMSDMQTAAKGMVQIGRVAGAQQAMRGMAGARMGQPPAQTQAIAAAPPPQGPAMAAMAKGGGVLTAKRRHALPAKDFALPGDRYPINDPNHARNALARVSQHGSSEEKSEVRRKVHSKYPTIGKHEE